MDRLAGLSNQWGATYSRSGLGGQGPCALLIRASAFDVVVREIGGQTLFMPLEMVGSPLHPKTGGKREILAAPRELKRAGNHPSAIFATVDARSHDQILFHRDGLTIVDGQRRRHGATAKESHKAAQAAIKRRCGPTAMRDARSAFEAGRTTQNGERCVRSVSAKIIDGKPAGRLRRATAETGRDPIRHDLHLPLAMSAVTVCRHRFS
jgi:hypothetical protein